MNLHQKDQVFLKISLTVDINYLKVYLCIEVTEHNCQHRGG